MKKINCDWLSHWKLFLNNGAIIILAKEQSTQQVIEARWNMPVNVYTWRVFPRWKGNIRATIAYRS